MRKIQIERKLFELFGLKFFVFENFQDRDLDIDDKSIYQFDDEAQLIDIFATKHLFSIWSDERRLNAGVLCACEGNLNPVIAYLKEIGISDEAYSTSDCGAASEPNVLYLTSKEAMSTFVRSIAPEVMKKSLGTTAFFGTKDNTVYP